MVGGGVIWGGGGCAAATQTRSIWSAGIVSPPSSTSRVVARLSAANGVRNRIDSSTTAGINERSVRTRSCHPGYWSRQKTVLLSIMKVFRCPAISRAEAKLTA